MAERPPPRLRSGGRNLGATGPPPVGPARCLGTLCRSWQTLQPCRMPAMYAVRRSGCISQWRSPVPSGNIQYRMRSLIYNSGEVRHCRLMCNRPRFHLDLLASLLHSGRKHQLAEDCAFGRVGADPCISVTPTSEVRAHNFSTIRSAKASKRFSSKCAREFAHSGLQCCRLANA
jgi:hypothetical protein